MELICKKCNSTFFYFGNYTHSSNLKFKNKIYSDPNIPTRYYWFACRGCDNKAELVDSNGILQITQYLQTPNQKYSIIKEVKKWN